jgi:ferric-dicitrate binding protein FerR (iron transport regulator)
MVPGTIAVYDPKAKQLEQSKVNTHVYTSWREGYFVFEKQTLGEILKKISRYYDVSIELQDNTLLNETFTGPLDLKNSAVQVLEVIGEIINARIEKKEDKIIITRI